MTVSETNLKQMLVVNSTLKTSLCFFLVDVDECAVGSDCDEHASCLNTNGSYVCTCIPPYTGDGKKCAGMGKKHEAGLSKGLYRPVSCLLL